MQTASAAALVRGDLPFLITQPVFRQIITLDQSTDGLPESLKRPPGAALFVQRVEIDHPFILVTTVLSTELVDATLNSAAQAKVITVEGQHLKVKDRAIEPVRERHPHGDI